MLGEARKNSARFAPLTLLLLINLFNYIDRQVLAAVVGPIKRSFFGSAPAGHGSAWFTAAMSWFETGFGFKPEDALLGLLGTAFMLVYIIGSPFFARLSVRISRWWIVGAGVILWSLASGASGLAAGFLGLFWTRCAVGIGEAAYGPVAPAMISDMYPVARRGRMLAWFYVATPVGSALGYMLGGLVSDWRKAFFMVAPPGIALGIWSLMQRETPRTARPEIARIRWRDCRVLFRTPSYVLCTLGMAAMTFAIGGIGFWMPYYLERRPGAPPHATIVFGAITAVAGLSATLAGGFAGDRLRARCPGSYFLVSGAAMLAGFPLFMAALHAPFPWGIWVLIFLACFCLFFNTGPTNTILANVTHPAVRAVGFAVNIFVIHALGDVISPVILGLLNDRCGDMNKSFFVVGLMFVVAGGLWISGARFLARDTAAADGSL